MGPRWLRLIRGVADDRWSGLPASSKRGLTAAMYPFAYPYSSDPL